MNRMFQRCLDDNQYRQALGLALETHRMDIFEAAIMQSVSILLLSFLLYTGYITFISLRCIVKKFITYKILLLRQKVDVSIKFYNSIKELNK